MTRFSFYFWSGLHSILLLFLLVIVGSSFTFPFSCIIIIILATILDITIFQSPKHGHSSTFIPHFLRLPSLLLLLYLDSPPLTSHRATAPRLGFCQGHFSLVYALISVRYLYAIPRFPRNQSSSCFPWYFFSTYVTHHSQSINSLCHIFFIYYESDV